MQLKQLIPQEFCLSCDICCRFHKEHTIWTPLFTNSEIRYLVEKNILPPLVFLANTTTKTGTRRINLIHHKDYFICPCFDTADFRCKIYINRPFECQLYPFLLTKRDDKFYLAQDKKCPYLNKIGKDKIKIHTDYLKREFKKEDTISFLRQNQELFVEYPLSELKLLFSIDIQPDAA